MLFAARFGQSAARSVECLPFLAQEHARACSLHVDGPIAQLVEQLAFNQWVAGSSPARLNSTYELEETVRSDFLGALTEVRLKSDHTQTTVKHLANQMSPLKDGE